MSGEWQCAAKKVDSNEDLMSITSFDMRKSMINNGFVKID